MGKAVLEALFMCNIRDLLECQFDEYYWRGDFKSQVLRRVLEKTILLIHQAESLLILIRTSSNSCRMVWSFWADSLTLRLFARSNNNSVIRISSKSYLPEALRPLQGEYRVLSVFPDKHQPDTIAGHQLLLLNLYLFVFLFLSESRLAYL